MPNSTTNRMSARIREASELRVRSSISGPNAETSTAATYTSRLTTSVRTTARINASASTSRNSALPRNTASRSNQGTTGIPLALRQPKNSPGKIAKRSSVNNIVKKRADKQVQTDKSHEIIRLSVDITQRDRSLSPAQLPCAICFNEMLPRGGRRLISLKCGHIFCQVCIEKWCDICKSCPVCMEPMNKKSFRNVYF